MIFAARKYGASVARSSTLSNSLVCNGRAVAALHIENPATKEFSRNYHAIEFTKYKITKPLKEGISYDDVLIAQPSKDDLAKFTKDTPIFLRFLKLVCDQEKRPQAFIDFAKRCENGLVVEHDGYITKSELVECMWENGFTEPELNAYSLAFPDDYRFHYPELAVLFNLAEEDAYKYCLRKRMEQGEMVELNFQKGPPIIRSYMIWYGVIASTLTTLTPFGTYYMVGKVVPAAMVVYHMWRGFGRRIELDDAAGTKMMADSIAKSIREGQDAVLLKMRDFSNDAKCLDYLAGFKDEFQSKLSSYRKALLLQQKYEVAERARGHLQSVALAEAAVSSSLQDVIAKEIVASFKDKFASDASLQDAALTASIASLKSGAASKEDPLLGYVRKALEELGKAKLESGKADPKGSVVERVSAVYQAKEKALLESYTVRAAEAEEIKKLVAPAKSAVGYDFTKLDAKALARLEELYKAINLKVGLVTVHEDVLGAPIAPAGADAKAKAYLDHINQQLATTAAKIRNARLSAFAKAFE